MAFVMSAFPERAEPARTVEGVLEMLEEQRDLLIAIATGTAITPDYQRLYAQRRSSLVDELARLGERNPFPWRDLHLFWAAVAAPVMSTYRERREFIHEQVAPVLESLERRQTGSYVEDWGGTCDGWTDLDQRVDGLRRVLVAASELDDWQDVGRRCREVTIDLANLVYRTEFTPPDAPPLKGSDAKGKLDAYLAARFSGPQNAELRAVMRSTWDLANKVLHANASRHQAFAAAQATVMLVRTLAMVEQDLSVGSISPV